MTVRMKKLKNSEAARKTKITKDMIKSLGELAMDLVWEFYNMDFKSGVVPKNWKIAVIVPNGQSSQSD